jgi:radical SAM superfamily enzyme YgiQ (UPF0313 family)
MRTAASIAAEIDLAKRRSGRFFAFVDDNIFLSKRRIAELTDILLGQSMGIAWGGFFRVDRIDESNVDALAESGCRFGLCGIESLDESQLGRMRKNCNPAEVVRGIDLATSVGMNLNLSLLVGYPGETRGSIDNTIEALNRLELTNKGFASWLAYPLYVLPGTAVDRVEYRRQFNLVGRRAEWIHDTMSAEEAGSYWSNYLYEGIEGLPYHYYAGDVPSFWSVDRRQRGFGARRELTRCFLAGKSDEGIQRSFDRLYREIRDGAGGADIPAWQTVLEERSRQPGARERYRGAF